MDETTYLPIVLLIVPLLPLILDFPHYRRLIGKSRKIQESYQVLLGDKREMRRPRPGAGTVWGCESGGSAQWAARGELERGWKRDC